MNSVGPYHHSLRSVYLVISNSQWALANGFSNSVLRIMISQCIPDQDLLFSSDYSGFVDGVFLPWSVVHSICGLNSNVMCTLKSPDKLTCTILSHCYQYGCYFWLNYFCCNVNRSHYELTSLLLLRNKATHTYTCTITCLGRCRSVTKLQLQAVGQLRL